MNVLTAMLVLPLVAATAAAAPVRGQDARDWSAGAWAFGVAAGVAYLSPEPSQWVRTGSLRLSRPELNRTGWDVSLTGFAGHGAGVGVLDLGGVNAARVGGGIGLARFGTSALVGCMLGCGFNVGGCVGVGWLWPVASGIGVRADATGRVLLGGHVLPTVSVGITLQG
ncbi:MAG: hypothetical protein ACODAB_09585 [Gemmatimonadota bacterium]